MSTVLWIDREEKDMTYSVRTVTFLVAAQLLFALPLCAGEVPQGETCAELR